MPEKLSDRVLSWASILDPKAAHQAHETAKLPFVEGHVALMPDAHVGIGATVGSVIPTRGAIIPAAVGVDLGCGMIAVETSLVADDLPDDLSGLLSRIEQRIPAGVGQGHDVLEAGFKYLDDHPNDEAINTRKLGDKAACQFGTLGSGNHFLELSLDTHDHVWMVVHSGSRGIGNILARKHIDGAKKEMKRLFISLPDPDLAYFVQNTSEFDAYIRDLRWSQDYAMANRERMMDAALAELALSVRSGWVERQRVNCHHNYTAQEHHWGKNLWITRKGAISAREGELGIIPGSMGTDTYIVRGLGNEASFTSAPHGAGRVMSRRQAKETFDRESLDAAMGGRTWLNTKAVALLDEHPSAYKDIEVVIRDSADLVEIVERLEQVMNYKGA